MRERSVLWKHGDFLNVWTAETISVFGSQFYLLAMPLVAVMVLDASPFEMGLLFAVEMSPFLLFGLLAGVLADRRRRRSIMIVSDIARAIILAAIPVTWYFDALCWPVMFGVAFLAGMFTAFFDIAYQAYLPVLVKRALLIDANSKLETSRASSQVAGPSIAGLVVDAIGAPFAVAANSASFLASAAFLMRVKKKEVLQKMSNGRSVLGEIREGLDIVFSNKMLRGIAGCTATANLFGSMSFAVMVLFMEDSLELSPTWIGLLFAVGSAGAIVGAITLSRVTSSIGLGKAIVVSSLLSGFPVALMAFAQPDNAFLLLAPLLFVNGILMIVYNVNQISLRQSITPENLQGKMNATMRFLVWGVFPIGGLLGGVLAEMIGLRTIFLVSGLGGTMSFLWVYLSPVPKVRSISNDGIEMSDEAHAA
ncbi:MAG: MFS transporter [Methanobacteriota archaeon]|nr:MAG: MFS transporter [Euryarchaeota archaeon]